MTPRYAPRCLALAVSLALCAGCGGNTPASGTDAPAVTGAAASANKAAAPPMDEHALAMEIANTLQACSYDGAPVKVAANALSPQPPGDCRDMVAKIMTFTGLPQNFDVMEADVPNAAAVILIGEDKLPHRVIAFNRGFMDDVRRATGQNNWAPVSIMAHEIGHHLSGHTIMPGGSQPPTELEADKFSGFVLYKMGAQLIDAQKAMVTLVPEGDGPTHPGRGKRVAAIAEGWQQACKQQGGTDCSGTSRNPTSPSVAVAPPDKTASTPTVTSAPPSAGQPTTATAPAVASNTGVATARGVDVLPLPDAAATPLKFGKFVIDEIGVLDPTIRASFEQQMRDHARKHGVEIVTMLVKDLHGLSADEYAQAMLRQLRVGKLDVGNGAVLVIAPNQGQVGSAMGPGVQWEMQLHDKRQTLMRWLQTGYVECKRKGACGIWTENFMSAADHVRRDTDDWDWTIRYPDLRALMTAHVAAAQERQASGARFDPKKDPTGRAIARIDGTVVSLQPAVGNKAAWVNSAKLKHGVKAVHVRAPDGHTLMMYVDPRTEALMPGGRLADGKAYSFVARVSSLSVNKHDTQSFELLSYDRRQ